MTDSYEDEEETEFEPPPRGRTRAPAANNFANQLLDDLRIVTDVNGNAYYWTQAYWREATVPYLKKQALSVAGGSSTDRMRGEMVAYIKAATLDEHLKWGRVADSEVPCQNGVVDVVSGKLRAHAPEDYLERVIPWPFEQGAECPVWEDCLIDWFGDDERGAELIGALQEIFGYVCLPHAKYKKAGVLYGDSDTGKSQVVMVLQQLVGPEATCQLSVQHMDDPVMRAVIKGKALNVMTELSSEAMIADGGFKTLVATEEPILINEKFKPAETYTPTAVHVIATNNLPKINDKTLATFNRLLIVPMERVVPTELQDRDLKTKLIGEMPGILVWAVGGARRLFERGGEWEQPGRSAEVLGKYREEQNPVNDFLAECCEAAGSNAVSLHDVTKLFNQWNAGGRKVDHRRVGQLLRQAGKTTEKVRHDRRVLASLIGYRLIGLPHKGNDPPDYEPPQGAPDG